MKQEKKEQKMRPGRNGGMLKSGGAKGGGRPRKIPELRDLINDVMGEEVTGGKTAMQAMIAQLRIQAIKGNIRAAELLLKYSYGMPGQTVEIKAAEETDGGFFIALPSNSRDKKEKADKKDGSKRK